MSMVKVKQFFFNPLQEHCLIPYGEDLTAVIVDPGMCTEYERDEVLEFIRESGVHLQAVLLTHSHFDHIYGAKWCSDTFGIPVYLHPEDKKVIPITASSAAKFGLPVLDCSFSTTDIKDGDTLSFGEMEFEVIHTPGHSPGGACYYDRKNQIIFTGDTLFAGTIGRSDLEYGNYDDLIRSIMEKLMWLDTDVNVFPGHGGCTNIGYERTHNPFLQPFNEKDPETGAVDGITFED